MNANTIAINLSNSLRSNNVAGIIEAARELFDSIGNRSHHVAGHGTLSVSSNGASLFIRSDGRHVATVVSIVHHAPYVRFITEADRRLTAFVTELISAI